MLIHVIGASGRSGAALCRALLADGHAPVPVVRDRGRWELTGIGVPARLADLRDAPALARALVDATLVVSCAHARHVPAILAASPHDARFVFLGSTRRFSRFPDAHGDGVRAGEAALVASGRPGIMLHPTMIYGAAGEDNVRRLAALLRRLPLVALPAGGAALVQPIYQDDVTRALLAAIAAPTVGPEALVICGPTPLPYADFVRAVAAAAGLVRPPRIVAVPAAPLRWAAALTRLLPLLPTVRGAEIRRLTEDKAFDPAPMQQRLGIRAMPLDAGLALTFQT